MTMIYRLQYDVGFGPRLFGHLYRDEDAACAGSEALMHDLVTEEPSITPDVRVVEFHARYTCAPETLDIFSTHTTRVLGYQDEPPRYWREVAIAPEHLQAQELRYTKSGDHLVLTEDGFNELTQAIARRFMPHSRVNALRLVR